jgi:uroporphyrinogen-III synthase
MTNQTAILSTKTLSPIQKQELVKANIKVIETDFIKTENAAFEIKNLNKNLIFTSQNAVLSILQHPTIEQLKQKTVFCLQ